MFEGFIDRIKLAVARRAAPPGFKVAARGRVTVKTRVWRAATGKWEDADLGPASEMGGGQNGERADPGR